MLYFPEDAYWSTVKGRDTYRAKRIKIYRHNPQWIPTIFDLQDFNRAAHDDVIKQVLTGQGLSFGYEVERHVDNEIYFPNYDKIEANQKKSAAIRSVKIKKERKEKKAPRTPRVRMYRKKIHRPSQRVIEGLAWLMGCSNSKALGLILVAPNPSIQYKMVKEHINHLDLGDKGVNNNDC